jgi:hypothetical protein
MAWATVSPAGTGTADHDAAHPATRVARIPPIATVPAAVAHSDRRRCSNVAGTITARRPSTVVRADLAHSQQAKRKRIGIQALCAGASELRLELGQAVYHPRERRGEGAGQLADLRGRQSACGRGYVSVEWRDHFDQTVVALRVWGEEGMVDQVL